MDKLHTVALQIRRSSIRLPRIRFASSIHRSAMVQVRSVRFPCNLIHFSFKQSVRQCTMKISDGEDFCRALFYLCHHFILCPPASWPSKGNAKILHSGRKIQMLKLPTGLESFALLPRMEVDNTTIASHLHPISHSN